MNTLDWTVLAIAVLGTGSATFAFGVVIPRSIRSMFRYRLWQLRDGLVDDILENRISKSTAALRLLDRTEYLIACSSRLSLMTWVAIPKPPQEYRNRQQAKWESEFAKLSSPDQTSLRKYVDEVDSLLHLFLFYVSPVGWATALIVGTIALPFLVVVSLLHAFRSPYKYAHKRVCDFRSDVENWLVGSRIHTVLDEKTIPVSRKSLSHCV